MSVTSLSTRALRPGRVWFFGRCAHLLPRPGKNPFRGLYNRWNGTPARLPKLWSNATPEPNRPLSALGPQTKLQYPVRGRI